MGKLKKIARIILLILKINWVKTLYLNFKTQKFKDAIKLPIVVFGKLKIKSLKAEIKFQCPIKFGLLQIGRDIDNISESYLPTILNLNSGQILIKGFVIFSGGNTLTCNNGLICLGKYVILGTSVNIRSFKTIKIGDFTRFASGCFVMDTNVHFILDNDNNKINNIYDSIVIGKRCWFNSGTYISKGAKIPDYSISSRNSLLNKNYDIDNNKGLFLVGSPAIIKQKNLQRIFSNKIEFSLKKFFLKNSNLTSVIGSEFFIENIEDNDKEMDNFFNLLK